MSSLRQISNRRERRSANHAFPGQKGSWRDSERSDPQQDLSYKSVKREGIDDETVPTMLEAVLLSSHGTENRRHMHRQFCIYFCNEETDEKTTELLLYVLEHPGKRRPLREKHQDRLAELVGKNFLLPWKVPHCEMNHDLFCHIQISWVRLHISQKTVSVFLDVCITMALTFNKTTGSPIIRSLKAAKASCPIFNSKTLIWI